MKMKIRLTYSAGKQPVCRQRRQKGGGALMFLCITFPNGLILLRELVGLQKGEDYKATFNTFIVPSIRLNMVNPANLVQDNCRIHTCRIAQECYQVNDINIIDWPSRSPDLNIVENIWKILSDFVYAEKQPKTVLELRQKINQAADMINNTKRHVIINLYQTFRSRLVNVLIKKGNIIN